MRAIQATAQGNDKYVPTQPPPGLSAIPLRLFNGDFDGRVKVEFSEGEVFLNIRVGTREKAYNACIILDENDLVDLLTDLRLHRREGAAQG